jgi:hypothetical protein
MYAERGKAILTQIQQHEISFFTLSLSLFHQREIDLLDNRLTLYTTAATVKDAAVEDKILLNPKLSFIH